MTFGVTPSLIDTKFKSTTMKKVFITLALAMTMFVFAADQVPSAVVKGIKSYGTQADIVEWDLIEDSDGNYYQVTVESSKGVFYLEIDLQGKVIMVEEEGDEEDYEESPQEEDNL